MMDRNEQKRLGVAKVPKVSKLMHFLCLRLSKIFYSASSPFIVGHRSCIHALLCVYTVNTKCAGRWQTSLAGFQDVGRGPMLNSIKCPTGQKYRAAQKFFIITGL